MTHPRRPSLLAIAAVLGTALVGLSTGSAAATDPPGAHDPFGHVDAVRTVATSSIEMTGWAVDPDALSANLTIYGVVDGRVVDAMPTTVARPKISKTRHAGATPGFDITIPVPLGGVHTVCAAVQNAGAGVNAVLDCTSVPLGTSLTSSELAAHDPQGVVSSTRAGTSTLSVTGWTSDPDLITRRPTVVLYVDGAPASTVVTHTSSSAQRAAGATRRGAFAVTVAVSAGAHLGCVWVVNVGLGSNAFLGCTAVDTRGPAGSGAVTESKANRAAVAIALKQRGKDYVWGAAGPKTFDCSGLVMFSYGHAGVSTPRVSYDQFAAAHLIPAARAVRGDLVFYHDAVGSVYHVGIYLSPGRTIAAIDTQEGVDYQSTTWDPTATYGSFTHT